jgi:hypothetical protein
MGEARRRREAREAFEETMRRMSAGEHEYGDAPVEERYREEMVTIMRAMNRYLNGDAPPPERKTGLVVLMFPLGEGPGRANYMSNGVNREDIVALFKEQIARFEGMPEIGDGVSGDRHHVDEFSRFGGMPQPSGR